MTLGDVLKKERNRRDLSERFVAQHMRLTESEYQNLESGDSPIEEWGPQLAQLAISLGTPTARLISETGKPSQVVGGSRTCGSLIQTYRNKRGMSHSDLAEQLGCAVFDVQSIEDGNSPLEVYAPLLLAFATCIDQPIFNLFYPCGIAFDQLDDYP